MGQFILFLLGLFAIGCVLYGIAAGVQIIQRGFAYLAESARESTSDKRPLVTPLPPATGEVADASTARQETPSSPEAKANTPAPTGIFPIQRSIDELRDIFALYQQGALTQAEFEGMKRRVLTTTITPSFTHTNQERS